MLFGRIGNIFFFLSGLLFKAVNRIKRESGLLQAVRNGLQVGEGTLFVGMQNFGSEPYLIRIGCQCLITDGVRFVTHDGGIQVPFIKNGSYIKEVYSNKSLFGVVEIGDNVFVGVGCIILPNTKISSNSIVAAGSVVKGYFEPDVVIGGNPAKVICSLEDYYSRNSKKVIEFSDSGSRKSKIMDSIG